MILDQSANRSNLGGLYFLILSQTKIPYNLLPQLAK